MSDSIQIHNLNNFPDSVPSLAQWHQQEWRGVGRVVPVTRRIQRLRSHLHDNSLPNTWIAIDGGTLVGSVSLVDYVFQEAQDTSAWLANLFVIPQYRHRGLGRRLLQFAQDQANHSDLRRLFLFTPNRRYFYQQQGWYFSHQARVQGDWVDVMVKQLNPDDGVQCQSRICPHLPSPPPLSPPSQVHTR